MRKARFDYRRFIALCAVLALTLFPSAIGFKYASSTASALSADEPGLSNEERTVETYFNDLVSYQKACAQLNAKSSLVRSDIEPLQRKSSDLQRRAAEVQNAIRDIVKKLKAADKWNNLDSDLLANSSVRAIFQGSSFKADLEDAAASLNSHANEINSPVNNLLKKVALRTTSDGPAAVTVLAAYHPPAPMAFVSLACSVGKVRLGLIGRLGGRPTDHTIDVVSCNCNPTVGIGLASGLPCSQVLAN